MKKNSKKKVRENSSPERQRRYENSDLDDFGLEPPKIYRESQKSKSDVQRRSDINSNLRAHTNDSRNLTKAEKRQKDNKKRKKRNKFRKFAFWAITILVFMGIGTTLSLTVFFHINNVEVVGDTRYSKEDIVSQCTIDTGENLFMADTDKAKRNIQEKLPYIYDATIKRKLPDTIEISVSEAQPQYSIKSKDKTYIILDDNFKVLEVGAQKSEGISIKKAQIKNATPGKKIEFKNEKVGECLALLAQMVKDNDLKEITGIYSKSVAENYVVYEDRITFKLGNCDNLEEKVFKGLTACDKLNKSNPNATGTMTITGGKEIYFTEE